MQPSKVAQRYAKAFYGLAADQRLTEEITADSAKIGALLDASKGFSDLVTSPTLEAADQRATLSKLFAGQAQPLTVRFLSFLCERDRLDQLADICAAVQVLYNQQQNILPVDLHTARPLAGAQIKEITDRLGKRFGKTIDLSIQEDPSLMGGFMVIAGDEVIDLTVRTQLATIRKNILNA